MFDSQQRLIVPIAIIGGGGYGTVYKAKRYSQRVSEGVIAMLHGHSMPSTANPTTGTATTGSTQQPQGRKGSGGGGISTSAATDGSKREAAATADTSLNEDTTGSLASRVPPANYMNTLGPNEQRRHARMASAATMTPPQPSLDETSGGGCSGTSSSAHTSPPSSFLPSSTATNTTTSTANTNNANTSGLEPPYQTVAVKEVSFELIQDDPEDALREVSFMYCMKHPNIIGFISSFLHNGSYGGGVPPRRPQHEHRRQQKANPSSPPAVGGGGGVSPASPSSSSATSVPPIVACLPTPLELERMAQKAILLIYGSTSQCEYDVVPESFSPLASMCVVEEFAGGLSLSELIALRTAAAAMSASGEGEGKGGGGGGPLEPQELCAILQDVLQALEYMHTEARIVHRDIKCANIALDAVHGVAKILDFGTCGAIDNAKVTRQTVLGTPGWIAPEVLEGGIVNTADGTGARLGYGLRSDMWSFGVTILELAFLRSSTAAQSDPFFAKAIKYLSQTQCSATEEMRVAAGRAAGTASGYSYGMPTTNPASSSLASPPRFIIPPATTAPPFNLRPDEKLFTPLLQDLVACCLRRDPSLRPSASELLHHPYFTETMGPTVSSRNVLKKLCDDTSLLQKGGAGGGNGKDTTAMAGAGGGGGGGASLSRGQQRPLLAQHVGSSQPTNSSGGSGSSGAALSSRQKAQQQQCPAPTASSSAASHPSIRVPYPMQYLDIFSNTFSEAQSLARLNKEGAAESMDVLKNVLAPAARSAPAMAMEIHKKFRTAIALQSGVPLASLANPPQTTATTATTTSEGEGGRGATSPLPQNASPPPEAGGAQAKKGTAASSFSGPVLPPEVQMQLQQLALGYRAEDPERHRRATALMERHVELLFALEAKLPGFSEKFAAKFIELLVKEHPEGEDVVASALQMLARLKSDVLKPDLLLFDPKSNTVETTGDPLKGQRAPPHVRMLPSPKVVPPTLPANGRNGKNGVPSTSKAQQPPSDVQGEVIDPTAFLFNRMLDHYAENGAAGGVASTGPTVQQPSRFGGF